jgi:hypothetical protein
MSHHDPQRDFRDDPWTELSTISSSGLEIPTRTAMTWVGNADMSTELMALRMLTVCANGGDVELLREGATLASLPLELIEADTSQRACALLAGREIDLVLVDGALPEPDRAKIAKASRESD